MGKGFKHGTVINVDWVKIRNQQKMARHRQIWAKKELTRKEQRKMKETK